MYAAMRLAEEYNKRIGVNSIFRKPTAVVCIDTGSQCNIGGIGHLFEKFKAKIPLDGFTGSSTRAMSYGDELFEVALLRFISFLDTFRIQKYKVETSKWNCLE